MPLETRAIREGVRSTVRIVSGIRRVANGVPIRGLKYQLHFNDSAAVHLRERKTRNCRTTKKAEWLDINKCGCCGLYT